MGLEFDPKEAVLHHEEGMSLLQKELDKIKVSGHRGNVEYDEDTMKDWGKNR